MVGFKLCHLTSPRRLDARLPFFLGALDDAPDDASTRIFISPGGWIDAILSSLIKEEMHRPTWTCWMRLLNTTMLHSVSQPG